MNIRIQLIIVAVALLAILYIICKIRNKEIELRYSLLWLLLGVGIILFACFPEITKWLACVMGISQPINMLFFPDFALCSGLFFHFLLPCSKLSNKVKRLTQEIALLPEEGRKEKDEIEKKNKAGRDFCLFRKNSVIFSSYFVVYWFPGRSSGGRRF